MTDTEWQECLRQMETNERHLLAWLPAEPDPDALRCVSSRHRTLAHLRACQESWIEACLAFEQKQNPRLKMLHPWRLFEQKSYDQVSWEDHIAAYVADRRRWKELLKSADRQKTGKINDREHSIESLTQRLVAHEHHHLFTPR
jgi:DinB superfamily